MGRGSLEDFSGAIMDCDCAETDGENPIVFLQGDCRKVLRKLEESSIDSIVTDPPYDLKFMGKAWDATGIAFQPEMWKEVLRVLKPGGHLLAFGGTRTHHRLWCAVEDAEFEIRDTLMWLYGSGFPKSLNVSKAIDKAAGAEREVVGFDPRSKGIKPGSHNYGGAGAKYEAGHDITAPATDAARQWNGWGTALKPAWEPILLARKPLSGTVAATIQEHGTGALNIDKCRIGKIEPQRAGLFGATAPSTGDGGNNRGGEASAQKRYTEKGSTNFAAKPGPRGGGATGRWPANVLLDEEAAALLSAQTGTLKSGTNCTRRKEGYWGAGDAKHGGLGKDGDEQITYGDSGGASRFFYCAKASRKERGEGNNHPTVKPLALMRWLVRLVTPPGGLVLDPFVGSGTTALAAKEEGFRCIGIDTSDEYLEIARQRCADEECKHA